MDEKTKTGTELIGEAIAEALRPSDEGRRIVRASDLLRRNVEKIPVLFDPVFPAEGLAILAGESDACKSMLLRNMAISVATGTPFLGWRYMGKHQSCIFISTEDEEDATSFLLRRHNSTFHCDADALKGLRFIFGSENILQGIKDELLIEPADLVVVDAYSDVFDGKEQNSAAQTRDFINPYKVIAKEHNCLIIFLHHTGKNKENTMPPSKNNFVGSQSLEAAVRLGIELRVDKDDPSIRHLCIVKGNYLGSEYKRESFVLRMDENFVFINTGMRTPFDELGTFENKGGRPSRDIEVIGDDGYQDMMKRIFINGNMGKKSLRSAIEKEMTCGHGFADRIISYVEEKGWISNVSISNSRFDYALKI